MTDYYYPMEPVRDLIVAGQYKISKPLYYTSVPLETWIRHPCEEKKPDDCTEIYCNGYVEIYVDSLGRKVYLEIRFFREKGRAFIRAENTDLLSLFRASVLTYESLEKCKVMF